MIYNVVQQKSASSYPINLVIDSGYLLPIRAENFADKLLLFIRDIHSITFGDIHCQQKITTMFFVYKNVQYFVGKQLYMIDPNKHLNSEYKRPSAKSGCKTTSTQN